MVNALLRHCPSHTLKHMSSLLPVIIQKLSEAKSSPLIVSLLSVCCELVLVDANQLVDYLSQTENPGVVEFGGLFMKHPWTNDLCTEARQDRLVPLPTANARSLP